MTENTPDTPPDRAHGYPSIAERKVALGQVYTETVARFPIVDEVIRAHEAHSPSTAQHVFNVAELVAKFNPDPSLLAQALTHDYGKTGLPAEYFEERGELTPEEHQLIATHTQIGEKLLLERQEVALAEVARRHHDTIADMPPHVLLIAAADKIAAQAEPRSYRPPLTPDIIRANVLAQLPGQEALVDRLLALQFPS